jgi:DNA invertase Pin-like site-specific DNA recombinase
VIGYVRVSTEEQVLSGLGLRAQKNRIRAECRQRGWDLIEIYEDAGASGKALSGRPALSEALAALRYGHADALVVAKLDRLSRSLLDFAGLMDRAKREGWALVALDLGVDTTTPSGEMVANVMATFAQFERRMIGQRTKDALAVKKAEGVRLGRPVVLPAAVTRRIVRERAKGRSLRSIAEALNEADVPTAHGGVKWYGSTVNAILARSQWAQPNDRS